ncbi:Imm61 family immunity protein [Cryobacterium suzukii]|nr:Imm61 family immunity protein [Cryobacterium suzukii]
MTINLNNFHSDFVEWVGRSGYEIGVGTSGEIEIEPPGGEYVWFLNSMDNGWIRVTRSDRGKDPQWEFEAASIDVIEHYFTAGFGDSVRSEEGLPGIVRFPIRVEELEPRASLRVISQGQYGGLEELSIGLQAVGIFPFRASNYHDAVSASHYCSMSLVDLRAIFLDPDARPLGLL